MKRASSLGPQGLMLLLVSLMLLPDAGAKLPDPTPEQAKAAAEKKAQSDAQAEKAKEDLAKKMDEVSERWRKQAAEKGWKTHPPTPVSPAVASKTASEPARSAPAGSAPAEGGPPVKSEKSGTAPPSKDVKQPESTRPVK